MTTNTMDAPRGVWTLEKALKIRKEVDLQGILKTLTALERIYNHTVKREVYKSLVATLPAEDRYVLERLAEEAHIDFDNDNVIEMAKSYDTFAKTLNGYAKEHSSFKQLPTAEEAFGIDEANK